MKTLINNFVDSTPIEVSAQESGSSIGKLVMITQRGGAMSFQHAMTPAQAREMAAALVKIADSFDEVAA